MLSVSGSGSQDSEIMNTQYELVSTVHLPWTLTSVKAKVPIIITSNPVDSNQTTEGCRTRAALPVSPDRQN